MQLGHLVTQSENVFKESVSLHSEQIGMKFHTLEYTDILVLNVFIQCLSDIE